MMTFEIIITVSLFVLGLFIIVKGGDFFVDAASWFSVVTGIPKIIVGATIVSLATTLPELIVSVLATARGNYEIAAGNAVGSVAANLGIGLTVGIIAFAPTVDAKTFKIKALSMLVAGFLLFVYSLNGIVSVLEALTLFILLTVFFVISVKSSFNKPKAGREKIFFTRRELIKNIAFFVIGATGIIFGADLLVDNGALIAFFLGVPDTVIALTIIAIGTSLPELTTALVAVAKKDHHISVGNIIGANVIDMALILPVCSLISGGQMVVPRSTYSLDIPVTLLLMLIAVVPVLISKKFHRIQGIALITVYVSFLVYVTVVP